MKLIYFKASAWVFAFLLMHFFPASLQAQVNISYALSRPRIDTSNVSNFTINGYRITNSNVNQNGEYPLPYLGDGILLRNCQNITISNCIIGPTGGRGIYLEGCDSITITNCIFLDNSAAIITWGSSKVKIIGNQFINVQDPCDQCKEGEFVQFRNASGEGNEIKNNVGENILGSSYPEDLINIGYSNFSSTRPLIISGNKLRGGGPSIHGGGINVGDDGDNYPLTGNVIVSNNKLVDPGQYGIAVSGGSGIIIEGNQVYGKHQIFTNLGISVQDIYSRNSCTNISVLNNQVNYTGNWPLGSGTPVYNPFWTNYTCGALSTVWTDNNFTASINETILPERILAPFPLAYLKFDNDLNDYSGAGLTATAYGSASVICDETRKSASFNGTSSDVMTLPRSVILKPSSQMITVSVWVKPTALSNIQGIIRSQDANGWTDGWRMILDQNNFAPRVVTDNGSVNVYCDGVTAGSWNHLVFTYDGKILKAYVNGIFKGSSLLAGKIIYNTTSNLAIGGSEGTTNFGGRIAEFSIYNGVKNIAEILAEYNSLIGIFNGTTSTSNLEAIYSANGQSKYLDSQNDVLADSDGLISVTAPNATSFQWQLLSGNPHYTYFNHRDAYISIPNNGYASLRVTATGYCTLPAVRDFTLYANQYEAFSVRFIQSTSDIAISKSTKGYATPGFLHNIPRSLNNKPFLKTGTYNIQVINMLGQIIKTGTLKDGQLMLNIGNASSGIYFIRIMNNNNLVYSDKIFKK